MQCFHFTNVFYNYKFHNLIVNWLLNTCCTHCASSTCFCINDWEKHFFFLSSSCAFRKPGNVEHGSQTWANSSHIWVLAHISAGWGSPGWFMQLLHCFEPSQLKKKILYCGQQCCRSSNVIAGFSQRFPLVVKAWKQIAFYWLLWLHSWGCWIWSAGQTWEQLQRHWKNCLGSNKGD